MPQAASARADTAPGGERALASPPGWQVAAVLALLALACAAAFWPVLSNGFVEFDDGLYVAQNPHVRAGLTREGVRWALSLPRSGETYWHPLTWLSLMLDVQLFGVRPGAIHGVNLALHVAAAWLLFLGLRRATGRLGRSAAVALLFAVHPLAVEAVAWTVERKTVLAGSLGLAAILAYVRYAERPSPGRYLAVAALVTASLLAKPMLVTLPFVFLLLDVWPLGRTRWVAPERPGAPARTAGAAALALEKVPLLAIGAAVVAAITTSALAPPRHVAAPGLRLATAITNYATYVGKLVWPQRLAVFYPQPAAIAPWKVAAALAALAGATAALVALRRRLGAGPIVGWLWYLGAMVPTTGIVRSGLWPGMADRFMYFPMIGLLLAIVWLAAPVLERGRRGAAVGAALVAAIAVGLGVRSHRYALAWRESETLFREAVEQTDGATIMRANLGKALEAKGRTAEAWAVFQDLARIAPDLPDGWVNLGRLLHLAGDLDGAEAHYARALAVAPSSGEAQYDLGLVESARGRHAAAAERYERAIQAGFSTADAWNHLGSAHATLGRTREAEAAFASALARDEAHWHAAVNLALLLDGQGRAQDAAAAMAEARARAARAGETGALDAALRALSGGAGR